MEDQKLRSSKTAPSEIGPARRTYRRTAKGKRDLESWLSEGPVVGAERIGYLAQVYFLGELKSDDAVIEFMEELRDYMSTWLKALTDVEEHWRADDPRYPDDLPDEHFYPQLTLSMGITKVRANLEWCEQSLKRIRARSRAA